MRPGLRSVAVLLFLALASCSLFADTIEYSYSGTQSGRIFTFTYDTSAVVTATTLVPISNCTITGTFTPACQLITFAYNSNNIIIDYILTISGIPVHPELTDAGSPGLFSLGVHTTTDGTLTVTDIPSVAATPEPSSVLLLGTGLLGFAGAARRRIVR